MVKIAIGAVTAMVLGVLIVGFSGCKKSEGPMERSGKEVDKAAEKTGQQINKTVEKAGDQLEKAGEKVKESVK